VNNASVYRDRREEMLIFLECETRRNEVDDSFMTEALEIDEITLMESEGIEKECRMPEKKISHKGALFSLISLYSLVTSQTG
jgi:hypothetical protein